MSKVILRQKAIDDLNDIWNYIFGQWSENQADKYYASLKNACNEIGETPSLVENILELAGICLASKQENI
jgi:toxin ParE1/3/4